MPYLQQSKREEGCLFCNVAARNDDRGDHVLYRGPRSLAMMNLYPYNSGHLMVVPYQHVGQLPELEPDTGADVFRLAQVAVRALGEAMQPEGYNLGINQGEAAGAGIADHLHIHIVPRWGGDTNFMPVVSDVKVIPETLEATADKLRPLFERFCQEQ
jgi:ATP adenylyltransferase